MIRRIWVPIAILCCCLLPTLGEEPAAGPVGAPFEDEFEEDAFPDYSQINASDAAWNFTLMRYLNFKENLLERNMNTSLCHRLSNRFVPASIPPYGFCEAENGNGTNNILVWGDDLAMNLAPVVYQTFKEHADQFNVISLKDCELMVRDQKPNLCNYEVNQTDILDTLKPDVIFTLTRSVLGKEKINDTKHMNKDSIFREQLDMVQNMERFAKKIYILQALPSLDVTKYYLVYNEAPIKKIKEQLIIKDDKFARRRIKEIGRRCKKCEIVDIRPLLVDQKQRYRGYDPKTNLMYLDRWSLFTRFGRNRIRHAFKQLADKFKSSDE
ncbi:unnamed protein product [Heligmosomoides polygyrus]|uniref:SGNH domain-containing protein n=1 Tax=Heligmosomoides polygyrus TaxID=6339 RepID=A0A3P7WJ20_HELPZ|nr:unnamed protein product [Heligmosomoides polygyrus]